MEGSKDQKTYITIPNKGEFELFHLLDTIGYLRQLKWTQKVWKPTPALIDKSGGSSRQYVGQKFDPKYFDLIEDGWTHDHCEICYQTISDNESYDTDGYEAENCDWLCKECYNKFIRPDDIQTVINSFKISTK